MKQNRNGISILIMVFLIAFPYLKLLINFLARGQYDVLMNNLLFQQHQGIIHLAALAAAAYAAINETTIKEVAIVKLSHIPYYVVSVAPIVMSIGLQEVVPVMLFDMMTVLITGVYMLGVEKAKLIHKVFGFIYILDIIAVLQLLYIGKRESDEV